VSILVASALPIPLDPDSRSRPQQAASISIDQALSRSAIMSDRPDPASPPAPAPGSQPAPGPAPKPWIEAIHAYQPGRASDATGRPLIKLSANESPLGCSPRASAARREAAAPARYPDPEAHALRAAIAAEHGLPVDRIVCGTGSDELLNLAAQGYAGPGDEVLYVRYGFSVYEIAARRVGATPVEAPDRDYAADIDALIACLSPRTRVVFLANPNNPTGTLSSRAEVERLHAALPAEVLLVIDQAYAEYLDIADQRHALELARRHRNVLVTRTFSKIYGLAGERVGWGFGDAATIATLNRIRGPFNVTATGQAAAIAALGDQDFIAAARAHNTRWRAWLADAIGALGNHGLRVVPSHANFLLVLFEGALTAAAANDALSAAGYAVRWPKGQGLGDALRITIGTQADMEAVAATLRAAAEAAA